MAAPNDAAASANILSYGSDAQALSSQDAAIDQGITADANADFTQDSVIGQDDGTADTGTTDAGTTDTGTTDAGYLDGAMGAVTDPTGRGSLTDAAGALNGNLLNVDVNLDADDAIAAPINGAVATYMKKFPVDELKSDRSFISGLGEGAGDDAIVESCVELAHAVGIRAVAEGVETPAQVEALKVMGCDLAQGYHYARPLPALLIKEWLEARNAASSA
ncbi:EAL domain-containing protein [Pseudarthrobacter phenanthrenivorans]|uniref:EAL domain-containing protein n=1 Tax=Pseudarthrobacter phenanthrenivorans TaxID=361575 RepID=UPI00344F1D56